MAYTDLTNTFEYKLRIDRNNLVQLASNDSTLNLTIPVMDRTQLLFLSATEVSFKSNKFALPQETSCLFSDGTDITAIQSGPVFKDIFDITREADWTSQPGSQGGLRPGITEASNTWYAIYFIRDVFSAVMVGDDILPLQSNVAVLNSRYGKDRWAYLGMIRNGDNVSAANDIVNFIFVNDKCYFLNFASDGGGNFNDGIGLRLASGNVTDLDWAHVAGVGAIEMPPHIHLAGFHVSSLHDTQNLVKDSAGLHVLIDSGAPGSSSTFRENFMAIPQDGVKIFGATSQDRAILLNSFVDNVLGLGYNALI